MVTLGLSFVDRSQTVDKRLIYINISVNTCLSDDAIVNNCGRWKLYQFSVLNVSSL